jgi:xanthine/uracil permease
MQLLNAIFACGAIASCAIIVGLILAHILAWVFSTDRLRNEAYQHAEREISHAEWSAIPTIQTPFHDGEL